MSAVSAILLAAGESRRMGAANKLMLSIGGVPLLRHAVQTLLAAQLHEVAVVLGHEDERARALIADLDVTIAHNRDYAHGQMSSVHRGIEALTRPCDGIMVCLADQPLLTPADIGFLADAFARRGRGSILVPTYGGRRGNPIVLAAEHGATILAGGRQLGCKRLIERNPDLVATLETANDHFLFDLDTPEDYAAYRRRAAEPQRAAG